MTPILPKYSLLVEKTASGSSRQREALEKGCAKLNSFGGIPLFITRYCVNDVSMALNPAYTYSICHRPPVAHKREASESLGLS